MIIATDIGNSTISIGYFSSEGLLIQRMPTYPLKNIEEYIGLMNGFIKENNIEKSGYAGIISSVVFSHTETLACAVKGLSRHEDIRLLVVDHRLSGVGFKIDHPETLGADRIANAVAAYSFFQGPAAVIDFGTATTISVVDGEGYYIGGAIMPGLRLMNEALAAKTSGLARVDIHQPDAALGRNTDECIRAGLLIGTAGAVERIITDIEAETGCRFDLALTGGNAGFMDCLVRRKHRLIPALTLEGLKILYEKNRP